MLGDESTFSGYLTGESLTGDLTRTLQLSPDFSDTHARTTRARRLLGSAQISTDLPRTPWPQRLVIGTDVSLGNLMSEYRPLVFGDASAYASPGVKVTNDGSAPAVVMAITRRVSTFMMITSPVDGLVTKR